MSSAELTATTRQGKGLGGKSKRLESRQIAEAREEGDEGQAKAAWSRRRR